MTALFDEWQSQQQNGPRLPKSATQQLWKRFRDARATVDKHRREFYAELDEAHKVVRDRKTRLVEKAEALAPKGEDGIPAYRDLLDEWKTAGRAGKKVDDALWARFKAAGDALYGARIEREAADAEASREKIERASATARRGAAVADEPDIAKARRILTGIQRRWDEIGRIFPREAERALDDDLRKIEQALRTREETDWKRNNPETKARANDMTRQLTDAIEKLEDELAAAKKSGDKAGDREGERGARGAQDLAARRSAARPEQRRSSAARRAEPGCPQVRAGRPRPGDAVGHTAVMASPFLYFADDRLSAAELSAARLDGHLVELGEAYIPADAVETRGAARGLAARHPR